MNCLPITIHRLPKTKEPYPSCPRDGAQSTYRPVVDCLFIGEGHPVVYQSQPTVLQGMCQGCNGIEHRERSRRSEVRDQRRKDSRQQIAGSIKTEDKGRRRCCQLSVVRGPLQGRLGFESDLLSRFIGWGHKLLYGFKNNLNLLIMFAQPLFQFSELAG